MVKQYSWQIMFTVGQGMGTLRPLMLLSPIIAETIAGWGWSKRDLKRHLFDHARIPAHQFERILRDWTQKPTWNLDGGSARPGASRRCSTNPTTRTAWCRWCGSRRTT